MLPSAMPIIIWKATIAVPLFSKLSPSSMAIILFETPKSLYTARTETESVRDMMAPNSKLASHIKHFQYLY